MQGYKADTIETRGEEEEEEAKKNLNSYVSHTETQKKIDQKE